MSDPRLEKHRRSTEDITAEHEATLNEDGKPVDAEGNLLPTAATLQERIDYYNFTEYLEGQALLEEALSSERIYDPVTGKSHTPDDPEFERLARARDQHNLPDEGQEFSIDTDAIDVFNALMGEQDPS